MAENASLARSIGVVAVVLGRSAGAMADVQTDDAGCLGRAVFSSSGRRGQLSRVTHSVICCHLILSDA